MADPKGPGERVLIVRIELQDSETLSPTQEVIHEIENALEDIYPYKIIFDIQEDGVMT